MTLKDFKKAVRDSKRIYVSVSCVSRSENAPYADDARFFVVSKKEALQAMDGCEFPIAILKNGNLYIG
jgi:hypothetical protein